MDKSEAKAILSRELAGYRQLPYQELIARLEIEDLREVRGASGTTYQLEFQLLWDDEKSGHLRVMAMIDDGGLRAFVPLTDDFIIAPDGSFIDE